MVYHTLTLRYTSTNLFFANLTQLMTMATLFLSSTYVDSVVAVLNGLQRLGIALLQTFDGIMQSSIQTSLLTVALILKHH
jgi:hypothetical protein